MKKLFLVFLLFIPFFCNSQVELAISLSITNLESQPISHKRAYLCSSDSIVDVRMIRNGEVQFVVDRCSIDNLFVAIHQSDESVCRVRLSTLINCKKPILMTSSIISILYITETKESQSHDMNEIPKSNVYVRPFEFEQKVNDLKCWRESKLSQLNEPMLCDKNTKESYRFVWYGDGILHFYDPYCFRIEKVDGLTFVYFSYQLWDKCEESTLFHDVFFLRPEDCECLSTLISKLNQNVKSDNINVTSSFEANIDGQYHVIFRGEGEDPALDELQKFLWSLTGLGENKIVHKKQRIE